MGHSAGAHIAAMLALDPVWLHRDGVDGRSALAGVVGLSGPYDFLPLRDPVLEQIFHPAGAEIHHNRAKALVGLGRFEEALDGIVEACRLVLAAMLLRVHQSENLATL